MATFILKSNTKDKNIPLERYYTYFSRNKINTTWMYNWVFRIREYKSMNAVIIFCLLYTCIYLRDIMYNTDISNPKIMTQLLFIVRIFMIKPCFFAFSL